MHAKLCGSKPSNHLSLKTISVLLVRFEPRELSSMGARACVQYKVYVALVCNLMWLFIPSAECIARRLHWVYVSFVVDVHTYYILVCAEIFSMSYISMLQTSCRRLHSTDRLLFLTPFTRCRYSLVLSICSFVLESCAYLFFLTLSKLMAYFASFLSRSVEQGLTSHSTQFRSFRRRCFYRSDDPTNSGKALSREFVHWKLFFSQKSPSSGKWLLNLLWVVIEWEFWEDFFGIFFASVNIW